MPSLSGNKFVLLGADRVSQFRFGFLVETKQALGMGRVHTELCLTFGVPQGIRSDTFTTLATGRNCVRPRRPPALSRRR